MLDVIGIGSMVVDRVHRSARILGPDEKAILGDVGNFGPVGFYVGGVVLNQLGWASVMGLRTGIFGRQADDEGGRFLRNAMDAAGIERDIAIEGEASSVAEIFIDDIGRRTIYMAPGTTSGTTPEMIRRRHAAFIRQASCLSTEISQLPLPAVLEALRVAREEGVATVVDLDVPPSEAIPTLGDRETLDTILRQAQILKPSKLAAQEFVGDDVTDPLVMARALRERFGNQSVVLTDGAAGCAVSSPDFEGFVPGVPAKALDTTGAGDAFLGGLLAALHQGLDWSEAAKLANACGAACTEQLGAFPEDPMRARARVLELYGNEGFTPGPFAGRAVANREAGRVAAETVLETGAREIQALSERHDGIALTRAADLIETGEQLGGRVHVTGVGKAEHVARYAAALFSSTGIPTTFLHATEALHGGLGQLARGDVVIAVSNSGETDEVMEIACALESLGCPLIAVTGGLSSRLASAAEVVLDASVGDEGGPLGLAPRASVAAEVLVLSALGASLQERRGFSKADYAVCHPAGQLGRRARS